MSYSTYRSGSIHPPDPIHMYRGARRMSRFGSYYTFSPHEIMSGFGSAADTFDPAVVWGYIQQSDVCYGPGGKGAASPNVGACNLAGQRAGKELQVALNELGYGPIAVDGSLSWRGPYQQYLADKGLSMGPGFGVTQQALQTMKQDLVAGNTPGPGTPVEYERVGGELVPTGKTKLSKQSKVALGLLAAGVAGAAFIIYRKKKGKRIA